MDLSTRELRLWDLWASNGKPERVIAAPSDIEPGTRVLPTRDARWLKDSGIYRDGKALLWDLSSLPGADARKLKRSGTWAQVGLDLHPDGTWAAALKKSDTRFTFFPLRGPLPVVMTGLPGWGLRTVEFTPDGHWLATYWGERKVRLWPLPGSGSREIRELPLADGWAKTQISVDAAGTRLFATGWGDDQLLIPLDGGETQRLEGFSENTLIVVGAFSPSGRKAAAGMFRGDEPKLRLWDLETGEARVFDLPPPATETASEEESAAPYFPVSSLAFTDESTLYTAGVTGVLQWDLERGTYERIVAVEPGQAARLWQGSNPQRMITAVADRAGGCSPLLLRELDSGRSRELTTFATCPDLPFREDQSLVFDDTLSVIAIGRFDGTLLVGRVGSEEPHLLLGHRGPITDLEISPDGQWIASTGQDSTLRLWPMPDLDKPPLHTLPHDELIAKLQSLTNLRAVEDSASPSGWSIEIGPFPGWEEVPEW
jgi:WD40 repeat protein